MSSTQHHSLNSRLSAIVGDGNVFDDSSHKLAYSQDYSPFPGIEPGIIVRPSSVEEIAEVLKLANHEKNPVIIRGGGASVTGFPQAAPGKSIILDTTRLNKILEIDEVNLTVRAECGILMSDLQNGAATKGLYVNTVSIPAKYSTLGGVLSGVVGGGIPREISSKGSDIKFLLGLKLVLPTGKILSTGAGGANVHRTQDFIRAGNGPDLAGLFIGDGGVLGVKTEATVQAFPAPKATTTGMVAFNGFESAWRTLLRLNLTDPLPYSRISFRESEADRGQMKLVMSYTISGQDEHELERCEERIGKICIEEGAVEEYSPDPYSDPETVVNLTRALIGFICAKKEFHDAFLKIRQFIDNRMREQELGRKGSRLRVNFQPVDRNACYSSISLIYDPANAEGKNATVELAKECYGRLVEMGCCPEPQQGFSSKIIRASWSKEFAEVMSGIKAFLDPNGILNPGVWDL